MSEGSFRISIKSALIAITFGHCLTFSQLSSAQSSNQCQVAFGLPIAKTEAGLEQIHGPPRGALKLVRSTGRSQPGGIFRDESGTKWYLKRDVHYQELQTSAEVISSWVYRHFGYKTPETYIVEINGVRHSASLFEEGTAPFDFLMLPNDSKSRAMRVVAALLRDWDRPINGNNLRLPDGSPLLLDFGGTLGARAQGQHKPGKVFSPAVGAFSFTHEAMNSFDDYSVTGLPANHPWQNLQRDDIRLVMRGLRALDYDKVREIVDRAQYSQVSDKVEMIKSLFERRTQMMRFLETKLQSLSAEKMNDETAITTLLSSIENYDHKSTSPAGAIDVDFHNDSEIVLFFHPKDAISISQKGFQNQHVSRKSSGAFDPTLRLDIEDAIVGQALDGLAEDSFRPKSALVVGTRSLKTVVTPYSASGGYGGVGAVLKSEVKNRSLWTYGDSLQVGQEILYGRVKPADVSKVRGTFDRKWMSPRSALPSTRNEPEFVEALIFGDLTFTDVDHFIVEYESSAAPLLALGKPVFLVTRGQSVGIPYIYKKILNFGETRPQNLPAEQKEKILNALEHGRGKEKTAVIKFKLGS